MATQSRTNTQMNSNYGSKQLTYIYGSAAPKYTQAPQRRETPAAPSTQKKASVATKPYTVNKPLFVMSLVAFAAICVMMIQFIRLSSDITVLRSSISSLESNISKTKMQNDEYYGRIMSNIDLEEVREIAVTELGMDYATAEQIITYDSHIDDYVEQKIVIKD